MIKIYGMPSCPDCQVIAPQVMKYLDKYQPNDIGSDVSVLKEFLRLAIQNPSSMMRRRTGVSASPALFSRMAASR